VQAVCQKLAANRDTATDLRSSHWPQYPHHATPSPTVVWKDPGIIGDRIGLKNGQGRAYLHRPVPTRYQGTALRRPGAGTMTNSVSRWIPARRCHPGRRSGGEHHAAPAVAVRETSAQQARHAQLSRGQLDSQRAKRRRR
jgi:hypothetical protein